VEGESLRTALLRSARVLGTVTAVGVVTGWLVVGVVSRLAMFLLVELNPIADGLTSDDGFEMGTFTLVGSANLMFVVGTGLGVLGAGFYAALRGLMTGPGWFRLLSVSLGAGVVVASQVVHADGVDFALLGPVWLAVGLFVLVPTTYVAILSVVSERLLARENPVPGWVWVAGLAAWVVMVLPLPFLLVLLTGRILLWALARTDPGRRALGSPVGPWLLRAGLAVLFLLAVLDINRDVVLLT
jgi:hypothetical protein